MSQIERFERFHALDALRAIALFLGVALHATMSFLPGVGAMGYFIVDNSPSTPLTLGMLVIHIFRMSLFFFIAGFFARMLFMRQGWRDFFRQRAKRILVPLVAGWIVLMPLMVASLYWGAKELGVPFKPMPPPPGVILPFPLTHLWFLWLLFILYVLHVGTRAAVLKLAGEGWLASADRFARLLCSTVLGPILLATPLALSLYFYDAWRVWEGIPTPDRALVPNLPAVVAYWTAFGFGWLLHRQPAVLGELEQRWIRHAIGAVVFSLVILGLGSVVYPLAGTKAHGLDRALYAAAYCLAIWCWIFALAGAALRYLSNHSPRWRYLSDSSYWVYLVHMPLLMALQLMITQWPLHWSIKYPLVLATAVPLLLLSYRVMVRPTFIGAWLNGRRQ